jgi:curli biogenesis system outer membrane secretion channel CsgG
MLVKRISTDGKMIVLERAKLQKIEAEQDLNASNRVQKGTGAAIGKIKGADALLYGDIVIFGRDDKKKKAAAGGVIGGVLGGIAASRSTDKAVVAIDYRLVDAETSEVIASGEARGESARKSSAIGGFMAGFAGAGGAAIDMSSTNFAQTIIGEATMDCVDKLAAILDTQVPNLASKKVDVDGRVAYVSGNNITINAGSELGVQVGDKFDIARIVNEVRDPQTHEVIDLATEKLGEMIVVTVKPKVSIGAFTGAGTPKIGDDAKKQ